MISSQVEPLHGMYLNKIIKRGNYSERIVEPLHGMYLNLNNSIIVSFQGTR